MAGLETEPRWYNSCCYRNAPDTLVWLGILELEFPLLFRTQPSSFGIFGSRLSEAPKIGLGATFRPAPRVRAPRFLVQRERLRLAWWESLKTLYKTPRLRRGKTHSHILRDVHLDVVRPNSKFQTLSLVAHVALILALIYIPVASRAREVMIQDVAGKCRENLLPVDGNKPAEVTAHRSGGSRRPTRKRRFGTTCTCAGQHGSAA